MKSNSTIRTSIAGRTSKRLSHILIGVFSVVLSGVLMTQNSVGQASITETILTTGNGSFVVPSGGLSSLQVEAWGGGGGGRSGNACLLGCSGNAGGGGGGGAYAIKTISSVAAGTYSYFVGAGGASNANGRRTIYNNLEVVADSGKAPTTATNAGVGGAAASCIPTANAQSGGAGAVGATNGNGSGGGGGGAGTTASGSAGSAGTSSVGGTGGNGGSLNGGKGGDGRRGTGNGGNSTNPTSGSQLAGGGGGGGWSNAALTTGNGGTGANGMIRFTYTMPAPTISSFTPSAVCGSGSSITITGTGFYGYAGTNLISSVTVNGVSATVTASNATSITFTVPVGASTGLITVTTSGGSASSATNLVVTPVPSVPSGSITNTTSPACPSPGVTLSATNTPPAGVTWYWQTANNGQSTALGSSASSLTITSGTSQTRWLQAQDNSSLCWSATSLASSAVSITSPSVAISNTGTPAAGGIFMGANSVPLSGFQLAPNCITSYDVTAVTYTVTGTATSADLSNFMIIYDANSNGQVDGGETSVSGAGIAYNASLVFTISHTGQTSSNRYLLVADVSSSATGGRTFVGSISSAANVTVSTTPSVSPSGTATGNTQTIRPANEECAAAVTLTPGAAAVTGSNLGATRSNPSGLTTQCSYSSGATTGDVWYKFTAAFTATYTVNVAPITSMRFGVAVFDGSCATPNYLNCNLAALNGNTSTVSINATAGTTYLINVWGNISTFGSFNISIPDPAGVIVSNTGTPAAGSISTATNNAVLSGFRLVPNSVTSYDLSSVTYTASGTATATDLSNFRIIYDANSNGAFDGGESSVSGTGIAYSASMVFSITHTAQTTTNRYLLVADVASGAVSGRTFTGSIASASNVTGTINPGGAFTGSATGNTQTIRPINDQCGGAVTLVPGASAINGSTIGAVRHAQASAACNYNATGALGTASTSVDVWYSFTATCSATYTVTVSGTGDHAIGVYSGSSCGALTYINCRDVAGAGAAETIDIAATAGTTYYISIWNAANNALGLIATTAAADFTISLTNPVGILLNNTGTPAAGGVTAGTNNAVLSGFQLALNCVTSYDFTALTYSASGTATSSDLSNFRIIHDANNNGAFDGGESSVSGAGISYAASLVFSISHLSQTSSNRYLLVADVASGAVAGRTFTGSITSASNATVSINPSGNFIGSATGNTQTIRPVNDVCAGSVTLVPGASAINGSTIGAFRNAQASAGCNYNATGGLGTASSSVDVWYSFTSNCSATYTVTVSGTGDHAIGIYSGSSCGALTYIDCRDVAGAGAAETFDISATAGTKYYISIWNATNSALGLVATTAAADFTIGLSEPVGIRLLNTGTPAAGRIDAGASTVRLSGFELVPACITDYTLTSLTYTATGTADASDLSKFRIIYDANNNGLVDGGESSVSGAGISYSASLAFTISQSARTASSRYLLVADVSPSATPGRTFTGSISSASNASVSINPGGSFTGSAAGNTQTIRPANDLCNAAQVVTPDAAAISGTFAGADATSGNANNDVWYQFVPTCTGPHTITVSGFSNDKDFRVYESSCPATVPGAPLVSSTATTSGAGPNSESNTSSYNSGTTYYIRINDFSGSGGTFNISIASPIPATPAAISGNNAPLCIGDTMVLGGNSPTFLVQTFAASDTFIPLYSGSNAEVLVVGGGGGGGFRFGGGGGGGAVVYQTGINLTAGVGIPVVVGSGGAGATTNGSVGGTGGTSSFGTVSAAGGGGGGSGHSTIASSANGGNGSSGGGASSGKTGGLGTSGLGFNGGNQGGGKYGAGGGGAGAAAADAANGAGSNGGAGVSNSITGTAVFYGGGGGGGNGSNGTTYTGGNGGGGSGGNNNTLGLTGTAGTANSGGGGGGGGEGVLIVTVAGNGGAGGSGVVIIKYPNYGYSSSDTNVVKVSPSGVVTAMGAGTATITYTVTGVSGCSQSTSTVVTVRPTPVVTISGTDTVCQNSGDHPVVISNPQSLPVTVTYNVNGGSSQSISVPAGSNNTIQHSTASSGVYTYKLLSVVYQDGTPSCGNVLSDSITVTVRPAPAATISGTTAACRNAGDQTITFTNSVALPIVITYNVNGGGNQTINVAGGSTNTVSRSSATAGVFTYNLVSASYQDGAPGCSNALTGDATVTINALPVPSVTGATTGCSSVTLTASGGTSYSWSGGSSPSTATNTFSTSNNFTVTVTDANNCTASATTSVIMTCSFWLGNNSNWHDPANWSLGAVPAACTTDVFISPTANNPVANSAAAARNVSVSGNVNITLNANLSVCGNWTGDATVAGSGQVVFNRSGTGDQFISGSTVFNNLTVARPNGYVRTRLNSSNIRVKTVLRMQNGTLATTAVPITLLSDLSGTAYVDDFSPGNTGTLIGKLNLQRYATGVGAGPRTQHQIAAGLSSVRVTNFTSSLGLSGADGLFLLPNTSCTGLLFNSPYSNMLQWVPSSVNSCLLQGYQTRTNGFTQQGRGYVANAPNNSTLSYSGNYTAGNIAVTAVNTGNSTQNGYNFIGNPYPSGIAYSSQAGFDANGLVYVPGGDYSGTYQTLTPGTQVASSQGFWVRVSNPGTTTYNFSNSMRVTGNPTWYRGARDNSVCLEVNSGGYKDLTTIAFAEEAGKGWDSEFDAGKLLSNEGQPTLFTLVEGQPASLNTIKDADQTPAVALGVHSAVKGKSTISAKEVMIPQDYDLLIEDKKTGVWHDLRVNPVFEYEEEGNTSMTETRFVVHFRKAASAADQLNIFSSGNTVYVDFNNLSAVDATIEIYNMLGQKLTEGRMEQSGLWSSEVSGSEAFYAVVKVNNRGVMQSQKVMIQQMK